MSRYRVTTTITIAVEADSMDDVDLNGAIAAQQEGMAAWIADEGLEDEVARIEGATLALDVTTVGEEVTP